MSAGPGVSWSGVTIAWRGHQVVRGSDFAIDFADWNYRVPIIGPSGCGKSTLLYGLSGMMGLAEGVVHWLLPNGMEARWSAAESREEAAMRAGLRHRRFAFAFQDSALLPHLTVYDNLSYPIDIAMEKSNLPIDDIEAHIRAILSAVLVSGESVEDMLRKNPRQLSGGQRRRVAIAQAMMTMPDILFLDEPAGGLDPATKATVMGKIDAWVDAAPAGDRAVLWVTHHIDQAEFNRAPAILQFRQSSDADRSFAVVRAEPIEVLGTRAL